MTGFKSAENSERANGNGVTMAPTAGEGASADRNGHCDHFDHVDSVDCLDSVDQGDRGKEPAVMSVASMMLDAQADLLDSLERPEILSIIDGLTPPPMERPKLVVELGAGIGRFTADLARRATWLTALDFLPHALAVNVQAHAHQHPNVDFVCADVADASSAALLTRLAPDLVFSNWLLMYLSDSEVHALAQELLRALPPGGLFFFRESCLEQSGSQQRRSNPTHYRHPLFYCQAFSEAHRPINQHQSHPQQQGQEKHEGQDEGGEGRFRLREMRSVAAYSRVKGFQTQVCWVWQKVLQSIHEGLHTTQSSRKESRESKENKEKEEKEEEKEGSEEEQQQYSLEGILRYEHIYGRGFVSTGGRDLQSHESAPITLPKYAASLPPLPASTLALLPLLSLTPEHQVLDVGCGLGGSALLLTSTLALLPLLSLSPKHRVLDVGCGLGGSALLMAETYGASVHAIDLSPTMMRPLPHLFSHPLYQISLAIERSRSIRAADATSAPTSTSASVPVLQFEVADCLTRDFPNASFDCIYTRDTLLHIQASHLDDKPFLFSRFHRWLKPGGRVLITDYCSGKDKEEQWSQDFKSYVAQRGYHLVTVRRYSEMLQAAGFHVLRAENRSQQFLGILEEEKARLLSDTGSTQPSASVTPPHRITPTITPHHTHHTASHPPPHRITPTTPHHTHHTASHPPHRITPTTTPHHTHHTASHPPPHRIPPTTPHHTHHTASHPPHRITPTTTPHHTHHTASHPPPHRITPTTPHHTHHHTASHPPHRITPTTTPHHTHHTASHPPPHRITPTTPHHTHHHTASHPPHRITPTTTPHPTHHTASHPPHRIPPTTPHHTHHHTASHPPHRITPTTTPRMAPCLSI
ncbi:unnamed protein product [Closterium sp. NIES-65]|nr:unnamed protein product [Closterium sp. NIES-65]